MFDQRLHQHRRHPDQHIAQPGRGLFRQFGHRARRGGQAFAIHGLAEHAAQGRQILVVDHRAQLDQALVHTTGIGDHDQQQPGRIECHNLQMTNRGRRDGRVLHHRDLSGQLGQ